MKILVLGHKGMLGHMVYNTLQKDPNLLVSCISTRFDKWNKSMFGHIDFIINCIGAIPQKTDNFDINFTLPIWLNENTNCKIIYPATDLDDSNDDYSKSKKIATDYINDYCVETKIIQTSIIGPELNSNYSLLEWFLSQKGEVDGYTKAMWNGITTYEWVKQCKTLIDNWDTQPILNIPYSDSISKFKLLCLIQECYNKNDVIIMPKELGDDRTLKGNIKTKNIDEQLWELNNIKYFTYL